MRLPLIAALALLVGVSTGFAADSSDKDANAGEHKAIDGKAVNSIDPVTGDKVDAAIAPVSAKTKDDKEILIGASSVESAATIKKSPSKYVDAALANKKCEEK
jgi:hypothetical protein